MDSEKTIERRCSGSGGGKRSNSHFFLAEISEPQNVYPKPSPSRMIPKNDYFYDTKYSQCMALIDALFSQRFSLWDFLKKLDHFRLALEHADVISSFLQKQQFLGTVYEKFFRGFYVKVADTRWIGYVMPSIVRFMMVNEPAVQTESTVMEKLKEAKSTTSSNPPNCIDRILRREFKSQPNSA